MRVRSEDILKPGAVLEVKKIDFNDPEVKAMLEECRKEQEKLRRQMRWTQEDYDNLRRVITI